MNYFEIYWNIVIDFLEIKYNQFGIYARIKNFKSSYLIFDEVYTGWSKTGELFYIYTRLFP